jgi:hypothetical protein
MPHDPAWLQTKPTNQPLGQWSRVQHWVISDEGTLRPVCRYTGLSGVAAQEFPHEHGEPDPGRCVSCQAKLEREAAQ